MAATRLHPYEEVEGTTYVDVSQTIDGKDYVQAVPAEAVEIFERSGWSKGSAKSAKKEGE